MVKVLIIISLFFSAHSAKPHTHNIGFYTDNSRFDLSTPEKLLESLCRIGEGPVNSQIFSVFYTRESSESLQKYEATLEAYKLKFNEFESFMKKNYTNSYKVSAVGKMEIFTTVEDSKQSLELKLTGTSILEQLATLQGDCATFISYEGDENSGVLKAKMANGRETSFDLQKVGEVYQIALSQKNLDAFAEMRGMFERQMNMLKTAMEKGQGGKKQDFDVMYEYLSEEQINILTGK
jgi:hypothetical protein